MFKWIKNLLAIDVEVDGKMKIKNAQTLDLIKVIKDNPLVESSTGNEILCEILERLAIEKK